MSAGSSLNTWPATESRPCGTTSAALPRRAVTTWPPAWTTISMTPGPHSNRLPRNRNAPVEPPVPLIAIGHSEGALIVEALAAEPDSIVGGGRAAGRPGQTRCATAGLAGREDRADPAETGPTDPAGDAHRPGQAAAQVPRPDRRQHRRHHPDAGQANQREVVPRAVGRSIRSRTCEPSRCPYWPSPGDKDLQVDPDDLDIVAATVAGPVTIRRVTDLTHILRRDPAAPTLGDYRRQLKQPVDSAVLQDISGWIDDLVRRSDRPRRAAGR